MTREYSDESKFPHANNPSHIIESDLATIREHYRILTTHQLKAPSATDHIYHRPDGWTTMTLTMLGKGVRLPLHAFIVTLLRFIGIDFT